MDEDLNPFNILRVFEGLVKVEYQNFSKDTKGPSLKEELIGKQLLKFFHQIFDEYWFEDEEELVVNENSAEEDCDWTDDDGAIIPRSLSADPDNVPLEEKIRILQKWKEPPCRGMSLKSFQRNGGSKLKWPSYKARWEKEIENGGTYFEKYQTINNYVLEQFQEARKDFKIVTTWDLRRWAIERADQFTDDEFKRRFKASLSWAVLFKRRNRITHRKITKLVSKREVQEPGKILAAAEEFRREFRELAPNFSRSCQLNLDQIGMQYELISNRTLTEKGEKMTLGYANSPTNKVTHSYTVQYVISAAGNIVGDVFLCLQEPSGKLGPIVKKKLPTCPNVTLTCSSSGKLTTSLYEYFLDQVLVPKVNEDSLLIVDHWSGQTKPSLYSSRFGNEGQPQLTVKLIPEKCTPICQPEDCFFNREVKYFARKIYAYAALHRPDFYNEELHNRNNIIIMHSLIHYQLSAPIFKPMIRFSWKKAQLIDDEEDFLNAAQACFSSKIAKCQSASCDKDVFIQCARCRLSICFDCFFDLKHSQSCQIVTNDK